MLQRKLGNTGIAVSKLALGTMYFGSETPELDAFAILDTFVEAGGNLIDTADAYVGGASEEIIGRWFTARPKDVTDRVVLASKGRFGGKDVNAAASSPSRVIPASDPTNRCYASKPTPPTYRMPNCVRVTPAPGRAASNC